MAGETGRRRGRGDDARGFCLNRELPGRVVLVTTHVPFRDVPALLTVDRVIRTGRITAPRR